MSAKIAAALRQFVDTVNATGGLVVNDAGETAPAAESTTAVTSGWPCSGSQSPRMAGARLVAGSTGCTTYAATVPSARSTPRICVAITAIPAARSSST